MSTSKIIKAPPFKGPARAGRGIVKRPVVEAQAEARQIVLKAQERAAEILERAAASAGELRETARREGLESALLELTQHLLDAKEAREQALLEVEQDILRLAVKIAEKIIGRELKSDAATLADIVATALRNVRQQETLVIRINPADAPLVQAHRERLDPTGRARFLDLVPDPRIAHGGCVIEGASGTVNAQLDTQLRVIERALLTRAPGDGTTENVKKS